MTLRELLKTRAAGAACRAKQTASSTAEAAKMKLLQLSLEADALAKEAQPVVENLKAEANHEIVEMSRRARKKAIRLDKKAKKLEKKLTQKQIITRKQRKQENESGTTKETSAEQPEQSSG